VASGGIPDTVDTVPEAGVVTLEHVDWCSLKAIEFAVSGTIGITMQEGCPEGIRRIALDVKINEHKVLGEVMIEEVVRVHPEVLSSVGTEETGMPNAGAEQLCVDGHDSAVGWIAPKDGKTGAAGRLDGIGR
jgi:hypothetical protein